jgi:hypothetical protein
VRIVRVSKTEFELESGDVFPIYPPLDKEVSPHEFQKHYERACNVIQSIQDARCNDKKSAKLVKSGKAKNN